GFTWQVDPDLEASPDRSEVFARFLREELGWTGEFRRSALGYTDTEYPDDHIYAVEFIRCAPGGTSTPAPDATDGACAPSIDDDRYETVRILATQPDRQGPSGIWVVIGSAAFQPVMAPPSDSEAMELLGAFLQARLDGLRAERFLGEGQVPLMYGTSAGTPYERFSIVGRMRGPVWPLDPIEFEVRLFADGGATVVEQIFSLERDSSGRVWLGYSNEAIGPEGRVPGTSENGHAAAEPFSFLEGEVVFSAPPPWRANDLFGPWRLHNGVDHVNEDVYAVADPRPVQTGCQGGPAPADAEALAQRIQFDPDLVATEPVTVRVGGVEALRMDVRAVPGASECQNWAGAGVVTQTGGEESDPVALSGRERMRLYLLDLPDGLSARTLAIAIVAPKADFEAALAEATPIVESVEFRTG
ncbi:MAG TPA: hypothetical protein VNN79_09200, partial [Actinomycetota bacterium]|nr:hypothetical protein [Actinomycetota bacterium]